MSNINGKAYAMNAITPMKPWKTCWVRLVFLGLGLVLFLQKLIASFHLSFRPFGDGLKELSFIHFARWVIVPHRKFPRITSQQPKEDLQYDYLFFFSNFNGTWNQYIDAFSAGLSGGLDAIWQSSEKFPDALPVTPFKDYIARVQFETDYYYDAYPHATTNDVKAAHRVKAALDELAASGSKMSATDFSEAYLQFLTKVQGDLGATGEPPVGT
jgi:hypothetical protein